MTVRFERLRWPDEADVASSFLSANEWPFHGTPRLSLSSAATISLAGDDIETWWIRDDDESLGMIRLLDLDDLADGSPLFDLRIAEGHRGRGVGRAGVDWLTGYLFGGHPELHRIEATTRHDNLAMHAVFARCGYRQEGRMVEAWVNADGSRYDALGYAILRREHETHQRPGGVRR